MSRSINGIFTRFEFTDEELTRAVVFPELNREHIQNEMAIMAERKAIIKPEDLEDLASQKHNLSYMTGYIEALQFLLQTHENAKTELQQALEESLKDSQEKKD